MPRLALTLLGVYFALAFGWRTWVQWRRTGSTGWRGISGRAGSMEWMGGALFVVALAASGAAPVAALTGTAASWTLLDRTVVHGLGILAALAGLAGTLWAQLAMGDSWRIGVDDTERTALVATGPFRWVRNPIYTSMLLGQTGIALLTPNAVALLAAATLVTALEVQVRWVEEPYLLGIHGGTYRAYAGRTGRFLPGLGQIAG